MRFDRGSTVLRKRLQLVLMRPLPKSHGLPTILLERRRTLPQETRKPGRGNGPGLFEVKSGALSPLIRRASWRGKVLVITESRTEGC